MPLLLSIVCLFLLFGVRCSGVALVSSCYWALLFVVGVCCLIYVVCLLFVCLRFVIVFVWYCVVLLCVVVACCGSRVFLVVYSLLGWLCSAFVVGCVLLVVVVCVIVGVGYLLCYVVWCC